MFLYHICREKDKGKLEKGYIGVSKNSETLKKRWQCHRRGKTNIHLKRAYKKYKDIIEYVVAEGEEKDILLLEKKLRPDECIGWNVIEGGGLPPKPTEFEHPRFFKSGAENINSKGKRYYQTKSSYRRDFKDLCKRRGWDFEKFDEVFSGEKGPSNNKKYYYFYKE